MRTVFAFMNAAAAIAFDILVVVVPTAIIVFLLSLVARCDAGLYAFEVDAPCKSGTCPQITVGAGSCVSVALIHGGGTVLLTAGHNLADQSDQTQWITGQESRRRAYTIAHNAAADIAVVYTRETMRPISPITFTPPAVGDRVTLDGVLSHRHQESRGDVIAVTGDRISIRNIWSHAGMSGGMLRGNDRRVFGIYHSKNVQEPIGYGSGSAAMSAMIAAAERKFGKLIYADAAVVTQSQTRRIPPCYDCQRPTQQQPPATVANACSVVVDYERLAALFYQRYGEQLRGRDGQPGETAAVNLEQLADIITTRYADRIRGPRGNDGRDGIGTPGPQGPRGLVGVPDNSDIKNWLVGASSDADTRAMLATIFADIVAADPRTESLIRRLEAIENKQTAVDTLQPIPDERFSELSNRVNSLENAVVPIRVFNSDGTVYSADEKRRAFEPIEFNLAKPVNRK